jgi:phosphoglycerate kinase
MRLLQNGQRLRLLEDLPEPRGRKVLVRATLDLPLGEEQGGPLGHHRAEGLDQTIRWLTTHGARVTICGDVAGTDGPSRAKAFAQMRQVVRRMSPDVTIADDFLIRGTSTEDPEVVSHLVKDHDLFVNDTFQWSYLPLPSLTVPPQSLPSAIGRSLESDLSTLQWLKDPPRPFVAVLGGDRSYRRLHGMRGLVLRADEIVVGGSMAIPFLQALGVHPSTGTSPEFLEECREVYGLARRVLHQIELPTDLVWLSHGRHEIAPVGTVLEGEIVDIGPATARRFAEIVEGAASVLWTGALGLVEEPVSDQGTRLVARSLKSHKPVIVGGDALAEILDRCGQLDHCQLIGATDSALELLKNGDLPALAALRDKPLAA